jgi:hypothetical protein
MADLTSNLTALKNALNSKTIDETYTEEVKLQLLTKLSEIGTALSVTQFGGKRRRRTNKRKGKGKKSRRY